MLTDKLGRQFVKGQKVAFHFDGILEAEVVVVLPDFYIVFDPSKEGKSGIVEQ